MPFYYLPVDRSEPTADDLPYSGRLEALASRDDHKGYKIRYVATPADRELWRSREVARYDDGTYTRVPWADRDRYPDHFVHLAIDSDGLVAYTQDDEAGYLNKKTSVRPGRYLERFYPDLSAETRATWIAMVDPRSAGLPIARTADEIETVYQNGPRSCMGPRSHKNFSRYGHPTRAYGDSDLAVAYLGPIDAATARAVVWPARKVHQVIYGDSARLDAALKKAGYRYGDFDGARIRKITCTAGLVVPYGDGADKARDTGDGFLLLGEGSIDLCTTLGYTEYRDEDDDGAHCDHCGEYVESTDRRGLCDECADARTICQHCDDVFFDSENPPYCDGCDDARNYCEACHEDTWDTMSYAAARDEYVCEGCARDHDDSCFDCDRCGDRAHEWEYSREDQRARIANGFALTYCLDCTAAISICHSCEHSYDTVDDDDQPIDRPVCPHCGISPRCLYTGDLFAGLASDTLPGTVAA